MAARFKDYAKQLVIRRQARWQLQVIPVDVLIEEDKEYALATYHHSEGTEIRKVDLRGPPNMLEGFRGVVPFKETRQYRSGSVSSWAEYPAQPLVQMKLHSAIPRTWQHGRWQLCLQRMAAVVPLQISGFEFI